MVKSNIVSEIEIPKGVEAKLEGKLLKVKGSKGETERSIDDPRFLVKINDGKIILTSLKFTKREKKIVYSYVAHVKNMIKGANEGHKYVLKICSSHFPMNVSVNNNQIVIKNFVGEKYPRTLALKKGATVKVDGDKITVEGSSKEIAGTIASDIEKLTKRANFDQRIFQLYMKNHKV